MRVRVLAAAISVIMILMTWQVVVELWKPGPSEPPKELGPLTAQGPSSHYYVPSSQTLENGTQTGGDCGSTWSALNESDDSRCSYMEANKDPANQTGVVIIPDATDVNGWSAGKTCSADATPWDELDDGADTNDGDTTCRDGNTNGNRVGVTLSNPSWTKVADIDDFTVVSSSVVKKTNSQSASISVDVKVDASSYNSGSTQTTTTSYVRYSRTDTVNPISGTEWTASDINGLAIATTCVDCNPDNRATQMQSKIDAVYNPDYALEIRFGWTGVPLVGDSWTLVVECTRLVPGAEDVLVDIGQGGNPPTSWKTAYTCTSDGDETHSTYKLSAAELNNGAPIVRFWDAYADEPDDTVRGIISLDVLRIERVEYRTGQSPWFYYVGGSVNADNGNLFLPFRDFTVKALGWPLEIVRAYNSGLAANDGLMGYGWTFTYDTRIVEATTGIANWYAPDGGVHTYRQSGGTWTAPPGIDAKLTKSTTFTLWFKDGSKFNFNSVGRLSTMVDKNGNTITLTWSQFAPIELTSVADDSGLQLSFSYQVSGMTARITMIQYPVGRQVRYWYDLNGNMYAFKDAMGSSSYYTYDGSHRILTWRDPVESPMPLPIPQVRKTTFRYDPWGRVDQIKLASVNAMTNATQYEYVSYGLDYVAATFQGADHAMNATNARNVVATIDMDTSGVPLHVKGPQSGSCYQPSGTSGCSGGGGCRCNKGGNGCSSGGGCAGSGEITEEMTLTWDSNRDLLTMNDVGNHQYVYTYDARRNLLNTTDPLGNVTRTLWSNVDNGTAFISTLNRTTNARLFTWYNEYDWKGNLKQMKDPTNNVTKMEYNAQGYMTKSTDWRGNDTTFEYDSHGYLVNRTDATLNRTQYTVDGVGRTTYIKMPDGHTWHAEYDNNDRVTKVTDPLGNYTAYTYNARNSVLTLRDPLVRMTLYSWNVTNLKIGAVTDALGNTTCYSYDLVGNLVKFTNPRGYSTVLVYDNFNRRTVQRDARGNETAYTYNGDGLVTAVRNRRGFYTNYTYDSLHKLTTVTDALGNITRLYYDQVGNLAEVKNARGFETTYTYDRLNRGTKMTDALGNYTSSDYDANGNVIVVRNPENSQTTTYDIINRPTTVENALGHMTNYSYDSEGNLLLVKDAEDHSTSYIYDALNRPTELTDGSGDSTLFSYDAVGNLLNVTDGNGNVTRRQFDALNRMTRDTSPLGKTTVLTYDANGNDASWTDPLGQVTNYTYDELDRLTKVAYPNDQVLTSTYDAEGNRLTATGSGFTRTKVYDALNRVASVTMDYGSFSKQVQYTYDEVSNRKTMTYPEDQTVTYTYDALDRLTKLQDSITGAWNFTYDADSRRIGLAYPSSLETECAYNAADWLMGVYTNTSGGTAVQSFVYTYDETGNRKTMTENGGNVSTYTYDDAYRLVNESYTGGLTINYTYDDAGNRLTETRNGVLTDYEYDADNRLTARGTVTYAYDDNGNLISMADGGQTTNYTWDYENRLTKVALPGGTNVSYEYTTDGKMLSRTQSGVKTWYAYDFVEVNGYDDMIAEYNATGSLQARYIHGPGIDEPLAVIQGGTTEYYLRDALGSVTGLASGQTLSAVYHYEAFGDLRAGSGTIDEYGFTSRVLDFSSDLYFYRARWYDSQAGRFLSKDPAGFVDGANLFAYALNNPTTKNDPSGMHCCEWWEWLLYQNYCCYHVAGECANRNWDSFLGCLAAAGIIITANLIVVILAALLTGGLAGIAALIGAIVYGCKCFYDCCKGPVGNPPPWNPSPPPPPPGGGGGGGGRHVIC
jgi:RHS repeat-associated protein